MVPIMWKANQKVLNVGLNPNLSDKQVCCSYDFLS